MARAVISESPVSFFPVFSRTGRLEAEPLWTLSLGCLPFIGMGQREAIGGAQRQGGKT